MWEEFKYLITTVTNHSYVHEEIKSGLISGSDFYHSVQNLLIFQSILETRKQKIYKRYNFTFCFV